MKTILVTGGSGFIGSCFIARLLECTPEHHIINLDALTYAGDRKRNQAYEEHPRYRFVQGNVLDEALLTALFEKEDIDAVIHFAAESHVDRSLEGPGIFFQSNFYGTLALLRAVSKAGKIKFIQVSTDEVYGPSRGEDLFTESSPLQPTNPYAASKAGADQLVLAFGAAFHLPVCITRSCNVYGPAQHEEKLIPKFIKKALEGEDLPLYGDGSQSREWIHVEDCCRAIIEVLKRGEPGEIYHIGTGEEKTNREVAQHILEITASRSRIVSIPDRPGHDRRYGLDSRKMRVQLHWQPEISFEEGLRQTIEQEKEKA